MQMRLDKKRDATLRRTLQLDSRQTLKFITRVDEKRAKVANRDLHYAIAHRGRRGGGGGARNAIKSNDGRRRGKATLD